MRVDIFDLLARLIGEVLGLPANKVPENAAFRETPGWDSFAHISLLLAIEESFSIKMEAVDIGRTLNLPELAAMIGEIVEGNNPATHTEQPLPTVLESTLDALFAKDAPENDAVIYIHSRSEALFELAPHCLPKLIEWLRGKQQGRTLVLPAFPFTSRTYVDYLAQHPTFDVRRTPPRTGLLPALAMNWPGVYRSAHPLLSELAVGPKGERILGEAHLEPNPFHPSSSYARLVEEDAIMLGLGVDIATNALIHMVDDKNCHRLGFPLYRDDPIEFELLLPDGHRESRSFVAYEPTTVKRIKPRLIRPFFSGQEDILCEINVQGVPFYRLRLRKFIDRCTEIADNYSRRGLPPPWFPPI